MAREIVIIGGLLDQPDRSNVDARLKSDVSSDVQWTWIACDETTHFEPPRGRMLALCDRDRHVAVAERDVEDDGRGAGSLGDHRSDRLERAGEPIARERAEADMEHGPGSRLEGTGP